jgi:septal ring factor EnvC (AmiA/AmiB activator)
MLYDNATPTNVRQLYRPVRGAIIQPARPDLHIYGVLVRTAKSENIMATTRGTLVSVERMADNTFTMVLQNGAFVTVYRHVSRALKAQGALVEQGESLGIMDEEQDVQIELWDAGQFVNPEEVIVW